MNVVYKFVQVRQYLEIDWYMIDFVFFMEFA